MAAPVEPLKKRIWRLLDADPNRKIKDIAKELGVKESSVRACRGKWKKARGYKIGTRQHPVYGLIRLNEQPAKAPAASDIMEQFLQNVEEFRDSYVKEREENRILKAQLTKWQKRAGELNDNITALLTREGTH